MAELKFRSPKGVHDVLPADHQYQTYIKKVVRHRARQAGYKRIDPPIFEDRSLFEGAIGDHTDLVEKELFSVGRKGAVEKDDDYALRPEFTAGICRAYIEHGMQELPQPVELYSIGPCFRYDRPQKGRYRQFHQFDFEVIGLSDPSIDAQLVRLIVKVFEDLKILDRLTLQMNNIGAPEDRKKYVEALRDYFLGKERNLPDLDRERLKTNPLRLLDSKEEDTQILIKMAPTLDQFINPEGRKYHETLLGYLSELGIKSVPNPSLVRGLDYYNQTVFEFWDSSTGAQNAVGGGGRYDQLIERLGGKPTPGVGFAGGIERIIWHMQEAGVAAPYKDQVDVFVAQLGPEAKKKCLTLVSQLRDLGVHALGALGEASLRSQMRLADRFQARYTLLLGQLEVKENTIILRDMRAGSQKQIPYAKAIAEVMRLIGKGNVDTYSITDKLGEFADPGEG